MKILLMGVNGHLGYNLLREALNQELNIRATVRDLQKGQHPSLQSLQVEFQTAELLDQESLRKVLQGIDVVIHSAAPSLTKYHDARSQIIEPIFTGTKNLFQIASEVGVKKIVMSSSCSAVGIRSGSTPLTERSWQLEHHSPLLSSKAMAERWAWDNQQKLGIELVTLCMPALIGPGYLRSNSNMELIQGLAAGVIPPLPEFAFHFLDVRDAALAHLKCAAGNILNERIIIAGEFVTKKSLKKIMQEVNPKVIFPDFTLPYFLIKGLTKIDRLQSRLTHKQTLMNEELLEDFRDFHQKVSTKKAEQLLGWRPRPLTTTLKDSLMWHSYFQQGLPQIPQLTY